jgi:hypothetical protein
MIARKEAAPLLLDVLAREVDWLDPVALDYYAERLAPVLLRVATQADGPGPAEVEPDRWMNTRAAAVYLGVSVPALHRLTAARAIPFEQEAARCKCFFKRSDPDAWRRREPFQDRHASSLLPMRR